MTMKAELVKTQLIIFITIYFNSVLKSNHICKHRFLSYREIVCSSMRLTYDSLSGLVYLHPLTPSMSTTTP